MGSVGGRVVGEGEILGLRNPLMGEGEGEGDSGVM